MRFALLEQYGGTWIDSTVYIDGDRQYDKLKEKSIIYFEYGQVPYRVRLFNLLAEKCDLTVLYERSQSGSRDKAWAQSVQENYKREFLDWVKLGNESSFFFKNFEISHERL